MNPPQKGVDYWTGVIAREPNNAHAYSERAAGREKLGETDKAIDDLGAAIRMEPRNADFYARRAALLLPNENRRDAALADINKALEIEPANNDCRDLRALILASRNRTDEALAELNKSVTANSNDEFARELKFMLKLTAAIDKEASGDAAVRTVDEYAAAKGPDAVWLLIMRGLALEKQEKFAEAIATYTSYIGRHSHDRDTAWIYELRAEAYRRVGKFVRALDDYAASIRLAPDRKDAYARKAWLLATCADDDVRDGKLAVEIATRACELDAGKPHLQQVLAAAYAECGDFDHAIELQTKALNALQTPENAKKQDSSGKTPRSFTIQIWPAPVDRKAIYQAKRAQATARLESYREKKPLRE